MNNYKGKFTKNTFKKRIKTMSFKELIDEQSKLKSLLMMARMEMSRNQNPMHKDAFMEQKAINIGLDKFGSMKLVKWKHAYISQILHNQTIRGVKS